MLTILVTAVLAQDLDAALDAMVGARAGDAAAYVAARDRVIAMGSGVVAALKERAQPERWTAEGWTRALAAESCRLRLERAEFVATIDLPRGLVPAEYRKNKTQAPACASELVRSGGDAVPLLLERWRWTMSQFAFSPGAAGQSEQECLRHAILFVPGQVGDARARHLLADVLAGSERDVWRQQAAVSLGMCAGSEALAPLTRTLDTADAPSAVREACGRALGRVPEREALQAIVGRVGSEKDAQVRRSLLHGLGLLGSAWGWDARGKDAKAKGDEIRKGCADALVDALRKWPEEQETLGMALGMTAWPQSAQAVEAMLGDATCGDAAAKVLVALRRSLERRK